MSTSAPQPATECTTPVVLTRAQYLCKEVSFEDYYGQFATPEVLDFMTKTDITLASSLARWDALAANLHLPRDLMLEAGEISPRGRPSQACRVCIAKTAYRKANGILRE